MDDTDIWMASSCSEYRCPCHDEAHELRQINRDLLQDYPERPTMLDHFAGLAANTLLAHLSTNGFGWFVNGQADPLSPDEIQQRRDHAMSNIASRAYDMAAMMLRERQRRIAGDS